MKTIPLVLASIMALAASVRAQEEAPAPGDPVVGPGALPTTARILGNIPDGTPPAPQPPKPPFVVPSRDILSTTTQQQGGRTITSQKIKPVALPPPPPAPEPAPELTPAERSAFQDRVAAYHAEHPESPILSLGATVYRFADAPPRTLVEYRPQPDGETITFWSSADFALISGIQAFIDTAGHSRLVFMMWETRDTTRLAAWCAKTGREYHPPEIPPLPAGPATFVVVGTAPAAELLIPIQSLHDLYNKESDRLKTSYEGRERARIAREAWLKANPPQPKDITLKYWRVEKSAAGKGGSK